MSQRSKCSQPACLANWHSKSQVVTRQSISYTSCHQSASGYIRNLRANPYGWRANYHHILDRKTGYPIENQLASLTPLFQTSRWWHLDDLSIWWVRHQFCPQIVACKQGLKHWLSNSRRSALSVACGLFRADNSCFLILKVMNLLSHYAITYRSSFINNAHLKTPFFFRFLLASRK